MIFSPLGSLVCFALAIAAFIVLLMLGWRDGDRFGDARVRVRLLAGEQADDGRRRYAEVEVDNGNDSPVMVSARARRASALALIFVSAHAHRTAMAHRDRLDRLELLGAVDGRERHRFLLPLAAAEADASAVRVTAVVNQVGRRTRILSFTMRVSRQEQGAPRSASALPLS